MGFLFQSDASPLRRRTAIWGFCAFLLLSGILPAGATEMRIVSASPNLTEMLYAIGASPLMAGRSSACDAPEEARALPVIGPFGQPDLETALRLRATLLVITRFADPTARQRFLDAGIAVAEIPCDRLSEIPAAAETLGQWANRNEAGRALAARLRRGFRALRRPASGGRKALALLDSEQPYTAGKDSFISDMFSALGVQNAGDADPRAWWRIPIESLATLDPDLIVCFFDPRSATPSALFASRIGWKDLRAVRNGRVYALPHLDEAVRPGPRILSGMGELRDILDADSARNSPWRMRDPRAILRELRMARWLVALLVGAALGLAGAVFQTILRNPLADPYILSVSGGASLGAAAWLSFGLAAAMPAGIPLLAFVSAFAALALVCRIARRASGFLPQTLILAGVMVSAIESSLLLLILSFSTPGQLQSITWWMLGSLEPVSWTLVVICGAAIAIAAAIILANANALNALLLGEPMAAALGVNTRRQIPLLLAAATLAAAAAVSLAGVIGFVGLVVPHMARRIFGANNRILLPASALAGALFVLLSDGIARHIGWAGGIPVGAVTALAGGPFFLFLLAASRRR